VLHSAPPTYRASATVLGAGGATDFFCGRPNRVDLARKNELFDFAFDLVVQFVAVVPEKFDPVILV